MLNFCCVEDERENIGKDGDEGGMTVLDIKK